MDPLLKALVYETLASACIGAAEDAFEHGKFDESNASMEHAAHYLYKSNLAFEAAVAAHG